MGCQRCWWRISLLHHHFSLKMLLIIFVFLLENLRVIHLLKVNKTQIMELPAEPGCGLRVVHLEAGPSCRVQEGPHVCTFSILTTGRCSSLLTRQMLVQLLQCCCCCCFVFLHLDVQRLIGVMLLESLFFTHDQIMKWENLLHDIAQH